MIKLAFSFVRAELTVAYVSQHWVMWILWML